MLELCRWLVGLLGHFSGSVVVLQLDLVRGCMCNKGMYHIEVLHCCGLWIYFWQAQMIHVGTPTVVVEHATM